MMYSHDIVHDFAADRFIGDEWHEQFNNAHGGNDNYTLEKCRKTYTAANCFIKTSL